MLSLPTALNHKIILVICGILQKKEKKKVKSPKAQLKKKKKEYGKSKISWKWILYKLQMYSLFFWKLNLLLR